MSYSTIISSFKFIDTVSSKNKIKKLLLLQFLQNALTANSLNSDINTHTQPIQLVLVKNRNKNVLLTSPFHFKTVKTHLYVPTFSFIFSFKSNSILTSHLCAKNMKAFKLPGILLSINTNINTQYIL